MQPSCFDNGFPCLCCNCVYRGGCDFQSIKNCEHEAYITLTLQCDKFKDKRS